MNDDFDGQIECMIMRAGPTPVFLPPNTMYTFTPVPGSKKGEVTTSMATVANPNHVDFLLGRGRYRRANGVQTQYRPYDPEHSYREVLERRKKVTPTKGFIVQLYSKDKGYIVVDKRMKRKNAEGKPVLWFAGTEGVWLEKKIEVTPFEHEIDAWTWLKDELEENPPIIEEAESERVEGNIFGKYECMECHERFENPLFLAAHWEEEHTGLLQDSIAQQSAAGGEGGTAVGRVAGQPIEAHTPIKEGKAHHKGIMKGKDE